MAIIERMKSVVLREGSWLAFASGLATMVGLVAAVLTSYQWTFKGNDERKIAEYSRMMALENEKKAQEAEVKLQELEVSNRAIQQALETLRHSGKVIKFASLDPADRQRIDEIGTAQSKLEGRLSALESALMTSPEKAVAVPMLKQEIDGLQDRTRSDLDGIRGEIGRLFTLTQWFIGLMFTIALGMFGLSFNLRKASAPVDQPADARSH
jgi:hypothetical protein